MSKKEENFVSGDNDAEMLIENVKEWKKNGGERKFMQEKVIRLESEISTAKGENERLARKILDISEEGAELANLIISFTNINSIKLKIEKKMKKKVRCMRDAIS